MTEELFKQLLVNMQYDEETAVKLFSSLDYTTDAAVGQLLSVHPHAIFLFPLELQTDDNFKKAIDIDVDVFEKINRPSVDLCKYAAMKDPITVKCMSKDILTDEIILEALHSPDNGVNADIVDILLSKYDEASLSNHIKEAIVEFNPDYLMMFNNPTDAMMKKAVNKSGLALQHIENKTDELRLLAIVDCPMAIRYFDASINSPVFNMAMSKNGLCLYYLSSPTYLQCLSAVSQNGLAIGAVPDHHLIEEIFLAACEENNLALRFFWDDIGINDRPMYLQDTSRINRNLCKLGDVQTVDVEQVKQLIASSQTQRDLEVKLNHEKSLLVQHPPLIRRRKDIF